MTKEKQSGYFFEWTGWKKERKKKKSCDNFSCFAGSRRHSFCIYWLMAPIRVSDGLSGKNLKRGDVLWQAGNILCAGGWTHTHTQIHPHTKVHTNLFSVSGILCSKCSFINILNHRVGRASLSGPVNCFGCGVNPVNKSCISMGCSNPKVIGQQNDCMAKEYSRITKEHSDFSERVQPLKLVEYHSEKENYLYLAMFEFTGYRAQAYQWGMITIPYTSVSHFNPLM